MSIEYNEEAGVYTYREGDLDSLKVIVLEEKLGLKSGQLTQWNLLDWKYRTDLNTLILVFKEGFTWPYSIDSWDPVGLNRTKIKDYSGVTFVPIEHVFIE